MRVPTTYTTGPALDDVLVTLGQKAEKNMYHYGPVVNNRDCEERRTKYTCEKVMSKGCVWNEITTEFGTSNNGCSACPYMMGVWSKATQTEKCNEHRAPNKKKCIFASGWIHNQCCAKSRDDTTGKWGQGHLCYG